MIKDPMLQFFKYDHLKEELRVVSKPFCELAEEIVLNLPQNPERTVALRKLLEAKDCAVRSALYESTGTPSPWANDVEARKADVP